MRSLLLLAALTAAPSSLALGDTPAPGFAIVSQVAPVAPGSRVTLPGGDSLYFSSDFDADTSSIDRIAPDGTLVLHLADYAPAVFASFMLPSADGTFAIVGESSTGSIQHLDLVIGGLTPIATLPFNYDAAWLNATEVVVSAATGGFTATTNEFIIVDIQTGAARRLGVVPGFSGPVAVHPTNGRLYFGWVDTASFTWTLKYWSPAQLGLGVVLTEAQGVTFATALPGLSSLVFDPVSNHLFAAQSGFPSEVLAFAPDGTPLASVATSAVWISGLEILSGTDASLPFQAFQPGSGQRLRYGVNDFAGMESVVTQAAARPTASISGSAPGAITVTFDGLLPNAAMLVTSGPQVISPEQTYQLGLGFPYHTPWVLSQIRRQNFLVPTDLNGSATFTYFDGGALAGTLGFQGVVSDANLKLLGTTAVVWN